MQIPPSGSIFSALGSLSGISGQTSPRAAGELGQTAPARPTAQVQHQNVVKQAVAAQPTAAQQSNTPPPANLPRGSLLNIKV